MGFVVGRGLCMCLGFESGRCFSVCERGFDRGLSKVFFLFLFFGFDSPGSWVYFGVKNCRGFLVSVQIVSGVWGFEKFFGFEWLGSFLVKAAGIFLLATKMAGG